MSWTSPAPERGDSPTAGDEKRVLQAFLAWQRGSLLERCAGLTGEQLARRVVPPSALSLLGLVRHLAKVERTWFRERLDSQELPPLYAGARDADFQDLWGDDAAHDVARFVQECRLADDAVAGRSLDETFTHSGEVYSLRFLYLHMIAEYARHCGHADLLRERIDGATG